MKSVEICSNYPSDVQSLTLKTDDEKITLKMELSTELIDAVATKVVVVTLANEVGEVTEKETSLKLTVDDLTDVVDGLKKMATLMRAE